ncbi:MAG: LysM peptidoglycan-binding domain-containing protein [bacterium]|nr:LysM peptidoglycan-binding domain-containing protein [bacterium]
MTEDKLKKAHLKRKDDPDVVVPFLFNPAEFTVEKGNTFAEINVPGLPSSILQFVRGNSRTISMELFFDTYEDKENRDVRQYTDKITGWDSGSTLSQLSPDKKGLMDIDSELHAPPVCIFEWGSFTFQCVIERVSKRFTMFLADGTPVRATLTVTLKEYQEVDIQIRNIDTHSADLSKRWTVTQGDSLWSIAAKEFGDPGQWRLLAEANAIDNPRIISPGTELRVPVKE